ncbi:MAG: electron transport complex protein RnfG, partial [Saprospiraceae bacterium]
RAEALQKAIFKVIPGVTEIQAFSNQKSTFIQASESDENVIYAGYDNQGVFKGVALVASGQGYADIIRIIYGYNLEKQKVIGFYVLESKETPGLGDKIEKDPTFLDNFSALDVALSKDEKTIRNKVTTVKKGTKTKAWEIDGITGATISSRAIGNIIDSSITEWAPIIYRNRAVFKNIENE